MRFFDFLFPPRVDEKALRAVSPDAFLALVEPRLIAQTTPGAIALLQFERPAVRAAIHEAKYHGARRAIRLLSEVLAEYLQEESGVRKKRILVPVPLGRGREKERGFNQVEEVAKEALSILGNDWHGSLDASLLVRTRDTVSQVSLSGEARRKNMQGAFSCLRPADPAATYILIDDVLTTGATLEAALKALQDAGALHVIPIALAH